MAVQQRERAARAEAPEIERSACIEISATTSVTSLAEADSAYTGGERTGIQRGEVLSHFSGELLNCGDPTLLNILPTVRRQWRANRRCTPNVGTSDDNFVKLLEF